MISSPKLRKRAIEELGLKKKPGMVGKAISGLKGMFGMKENLSLTSEQLRTMAQEELKNLIKEKRK